MRTIPLLTAVAITLCACSRTPESIAPSYVPPMKNTASNAAVCQSVQDALPKGAYSPQEVWLLFTELLSSKMNGASEQLTRIVVQDTMNKQLDELISFTYGMNRETTEMISMMCSHG